MRIKLLFSFFRSSYLYCPFLGWPSLFLSSLAPPFPLYLLFPVPLYGRGEGTIGLGRSRLWRRRCFEDPQWYDMIWYWEFIIWREDHTQIAINKNINWSFNVTLCVCVYQLEERREKSVLRTWWCISPNTLIYIDSSIWIWIRKKRAHMCSVIGGTGKVARWR